MSIRPLSAALRKRAEEELNETPSRIISDIKTLRDWLKQQPHLHLVNPSDQFLISFLRGSKYNMQKAKGKLDMYYTLKATVPEFYHNRDPFDPVIQKILETGPLLPLRKLMREDSPRIVIARAEAFSQTQQPLADYIKVCLMVVEILLLEDDNFAIAGEDVLLDGKNLSVGVIWQFTPSFAMKFVSGSEKALSVRLKSLHAVNGSYFMTTAISIVKMFLGSKIKNRFYTHSKDWQTLYDHMDRSVLPAEYGGTDGTVQELIDHWKAKIESYREWFIDVNGYSDESKRPSNHNSGGFFSNIGRPFQTSEID